MRSGDFAVEVLPIPPARVRELESGHVLARPGTVYRLRLRNLGPLRAVVDIEIDGRPVTLGGLVLDPFSVTDLERPMNEGVDGRFTVAAEGDEAAFGPDGGRDNESLGLIDALFRRELPPPSPPPPPPSPRHDHWIPDLDSIVSELGAEYGGTPEDIPPISRSRIESLLTGRRVVREPLSVPVIERAAGTGLTGHSDQTFIPIRLGPLEDEATVIQLRLVIGSEAAIHEISALGPEKETPARPVARP